MSTTTPPAAEALEPLESLELMLQLIHELSGPLSAMSIELAMIEELLESAATSRRAAPAGELQDALVGLRTNLDRSIDRFHEARTLLRARREAEAP